MVRCSQCGMRVASTLYLPRYIVKGVVYPEQRLDLQECLICWKEIIDERIKELSDLFGPP